MSNRAAYALLILLLALGAGLKLAYDPVAVRPGEWDSNYYLQVAQEVAAGNGLVTRASIHSRGYRDLPHPTVMYPLWPWLMGQAARVAPLEAAATALAEALYLLSLLLLYPLANAAARGVRAGGDVPFARLPGLRAGHVAVAALALHPAYFEYSSLPFTDPLALTLGFGALLAAKGTRGSRPLRMAALAGALAGLAYLARYQMAAAAMAIALACAVVGRFDRQALRTAFVACVATALVVVPWWAHLATFVRPHTIRILFDISAYMESPELLPPSKHVGAATVAEAAQARLEGAWVAFHPTHDESYLRAFGPLAWLPPLALVLGVLAAVKSRERASPVAADPASPEAGDRVVLWAVLACGLISLLPVHLTRWDGPHEWWFHDRHGVPMILLLAPSLAVLLGRGRVLAGLVGAAIVASLAVQVGATREVFRAKPYAAQPDPYTRALVAWIDAHASPPIAITTQPRYLAVLTRGGFHRIACDAPPEQMRRLVAHMQPDYVISYFDEASRCGSFRGLRKLAAPVRQVGEGRRGIVVWQVHGRTPEGAPPEAPSAAGAAPAGARQQPAAGVQATR